jgi:hypothetical protein
MMTDGGHDPNHARDMGAIYSFLALELASLADLRDWPPVGALAQSVRDAIAGVGGLSAREVDQIRDWSSRWACVRPEIRCFYADMAPESPSVSHCLRRLLDGGPEIEGPQKGALRKAWLDHAGGDPPFPLWWRIRA